MISRGEKQGHARPPRVRCGPMRIASHGKFKTHTQANTSTPCATPGRVIGKNTGGGLARDGRTGDARRAGGRAGRKTADGRQPRVTKGQNRRQGDGGGDPAIKRGEHKEHGEDRASGPFPSRTQEGEKKGVAGGRKMASERATRRGTRGFKEDNDLCLR